MGFKWAAYVEGTHIVGFHMTSLKFKLQNYRSYWDFTFMVYTPYSQMADTREKTGA